MQTRFVSTGALKDNSQVWLAYELNEAAFRLDLRVVDKKLINELQVEALNNTWVDGGAFEFPEGTELINPDLNADSILPEHIRSEKTGEIRHKQNEWAIQLLTSKIWESYLLELAALKQKAATIPKYSSALFEETKSFWERVVEHKKDRNISEERLQEIKAEVNSIFDKLKEFRKTESAEYEKLSKVHKEVIFTKLEVIKKKAEESGNFKTLSEEIKALQVEYKGTRFMKADENVIRRAYDDTFHFINEQRVKYHSGRYETRITGLKDAVTKIERGLNRDRKDLEYFTKKSDNPKILALELQLLKVRIRQLKETVRSKEDKVSDIHKTIEGILEQLHKNDATSRPKQNNRPPKADKTVATTQQPATTVDAVTTPAADHSQAQAEVVVTHDTPALQVQEVSIITDNAPDAVEPNQAPESA
jgi:hypothetical protein